MFNQDHSVVLKSTQEHSGVLKSKVNGVMWFISAIDTMLISAHECQRVVKITLGTRVPCPLVLMDGLACS